MLEDRSSNIKNILFDASYVNILKSTLSYFQWKISSLHLVSKKTTRNIMFVYLLKS